MSKLLRVTLPQFKNVTMFEYITKVYHSDCGAETGIYLSSCINWEQ